jgi:hypothetical protein
MMMLLRLFRPGAFSLVLVSLFAISGVGFEARASGEIASLDLTAFDGHWERVDEVQDEERRVAAINRAVEGMSWLMQRIAGSVLRRSTRPPEEIKFVWNGSELQELAKDQKDRQYRPIRLDGNTRMAQDDNGEVSLSWHPAPNGMRLRWEQHQAHGNNVYWVEEAGKVLIVEHTIQITAVSNVAPIVYQSHFMRRELPHISAAPPR